LRVDLAEFLLGNVRHRHLAVKQYGAAGRCALVNSKNVGHDLPIFIRF
jgi:hypothetical protein